MIVCLITLFILFTQPLQAQNNDNQLLVNKYQTDYLYKRDLYQQAYFNFSEKKDIDQKYQTVATQTNKIDATKEALITRNEMLQTYLMVLRTKLNEYKFVNSEITQNYQTFFQKEEDWLSLQKQIINNFQKENEIKNWIADFQNRYKDTSANINYALIQYKINAYNKAISDMKSLLIEIEKSPSLTDEGKQWLSGIPPKIHQASIFLEDSYNFTQKNQYGFVKDNFFKDAQLQLNKTTSLLNEIKNDLVWIFIKYFEI